MSGLRSLPVLPLVLVSILLVGAAWLLWDVATDDAPAAAGDQFARIDAYVDDQRVDSRIPGVAFAIVDDGAVVHTGGFGEDGNGNQISADTPFWIGSNTKSMTALAVMQLVESGAIDLDAPVRAYLSDFAVADEAASAQITVRHLLNQTSGISRVDGLRSVIDADTDETIQDVVAGMAALELNRPVGERFEYANLNSVVLGAVIEAVTGQTWQDYVQTNIFDPLGMTNTYTDRASAEANGLTATHRSFFGFPIAADADHYPGLAPTGYVYTSANDMARYLTVYTNGGELGGQQILSHAGIDEMLTAATNERTFALQSQSFTARYGAGWFVGPFASADDARWHQGSLPHFTTWMVLLPETDQAVIVMLNEGNQFEIGGANAAWSRIPQGVVDILRGNEPPTGAGSARFFIIFATLAAAAVAAQAWTLVSVAKRSASRMRLSVTRAAPLLWELAIAPLVLLGYPAIYGGLGWNAAFAVVPDLSLTVLVIGGLAVATGLARLTRLIRSRTRSSSRPPSADIDLRPPTHQPAVTPTMTPDPVRQHQ